MKYRILRFIRVLVAFCVLAAFIIYFIDLSSFFYTLNETILGKIESLVEAEKLPSFFAKSRQALASMGAATAQLPKIQFLPSMLAGSFVVFGCLVAATLLFGRVYCSVVCPLGILQDVIAWFGRIFVKFCTRDEKAKKQAEAYKEAVKKAAEEGKPAPPKKPRKLQPLRNYEYRKNPLAIRVAFLIFAVLSTLLGGVYLGLIEPYGAFGRIAVNVFKPLFAMINNGLYDYYNARDNYTFFYYGLHLESVGAFVMGVAMFVVLLVFAGRWGRLYCNSVCPVGTILGALSRFSFFRTRIDASKCIKCGMCAKRCKSSCIDHKNKRVDASRCVVCFDCFSACKKDALYYGIPRRVKETSDEAQKQKLEAEKETVLRELEGFDRGKRQFITLSLAATTAAITHVALGDDPITSASDVSAESPDGAEAADVSNEAEENKPADYGTNPFTREHIITPPGSLSLERFQNRCVGCHLCVTKCPQRIIKPAGLEAGLKGFMQPRLDFTYGFCNYDCTKCCDVCPAGALLPLPKEEKQLKQMGHVVFIKENCIVYAKETSCGACSEHCPTQALHMIPYKGTLTIPEADVTLCVGCGGCEFICPARPFRAVYIEGHPVHTEARPVEKQESVEVENVDFGF